MSTCRQQFNPLTVILPRDAKQNSIYVVCLSVCPSVCDVGVWFSHRLEYF